MYMGFMMLGRWIYKQLGHQFHNLAWSKWKLLLSSSFLGSTAQLRPWPPPQNPAEFLGGFSTIFFFTG
jgi:hypothetical protein